MMTKTKLGLVAGCLVLAGAGSARADRRAFTHTYEYMTQPKGNLELEFWNTQETARYATDSDTAFRSEVEVEYGITDHWDIALYQIYEGGEAGGVPVLGYHETKLESRYRLAERGEWPVDVVLYLEVFKPFGIAAVGTEPKLILARDFGPVTVAANVAVEADPGEEADATGKIKVKYEFEPQFAAGFTWEADPEWKLGAESWGNFEAFEGGATGGYGVYAGPALNWSPSARLWTTATAGFLLTGFDDASKFVFSFGIGLHL